MSGLISRTVHYEISDTFGLLLAFAFEYLITPSLPIHTPPLPPLPPQKFPTILGTKDSQFHLFDPSGYLSTNTRLGVFSARLPQTK